MDRNPNQPVDRAELAASLERLGIRELEERMEVSPLLTDAGIEGVDREGSICCTCKIPDPFGPDGTLPYPSDVPGSTGPTNPNGIF